MHATARVAAVMAGAEGTNTVEEIAVEGTTVRWSVRRAGGWGFDELVVTDAAVAEFVLEVMAARARVTAGGRGRSTSGS